MHCETGIWRFLPKYNIMWEKRINETKQPINKWHHPNDRKRRTKEPLDEAERGEWKRWLKTQHLKNEDHSIQSHHFMANRWVKMETVMDFIFLASKITVDSDCNQEIKRHLILGGKAMMHLDSVLKSKDTTLPTKICIFKVMIFPVVIYGCESWTIKKAENQRIDAFELWCWRKLLSPLDCKGISQS